MSSFKEFLDKHHKETWSIGEPQVSVRSLGEWAWGKYLFHHTIWEGTTFNDLKKANEIDADETTTYWEIAVACLGEAWVGKRIAEIKRIYEKKANESIKSRLRVENGGGE